MIRRKQQPQSTVPTCEEIEREARLVDAEKRANVLVQTAEWLHSTVARRDEENHWQASVNQLFLGGTS